MTSSQEKKNGDTKKKRPVVWANAEELLEFVLQERQVIGYYIVKIMADGGQGFFKVCMSIIPDNNLNEEADVDTLDSEGLDESKKKRTTYAEGGTVGKEASVTSVYKLIMVCIVPEIKEEYDNIKFLLDLVKINDLAFKFISDFKLLLIVNGQQTATAMFPCPYCFISLNDLKNKSDLISENSDEYELKNFGHLKKDFERFSKFGKNKKFSKDCHSTVNMPIFEENDEVPVLEKCILPELHLLQGFVNHVFWDGLVPLVGVEKALLWPTKLHLVPSNYHGQAFEGNACRMLLEEADKLLDKEIYGEVGIFQIVPYVTVFQDMNNIVHAFFSSKKVKIENAYPLIDVLKKSYLAIEVSETLKIHILISHLAKGLSFLNGDGLGTWSEQAGESIHREFVKFWNKYKLKMIDSPLYGEKLKKAVLDFSSQHL